MPLDVRKLSKRFENVFPPDLVVSAVRDWVDYRLAGEPRLLTDSREAYVDHHLERCLGAIALIPARQVRGRLLELGSGIYLMTFLLARLRDYDLELAQYWGRPSGPYGSMLVNARTGERKIMPFQEFDGERETFPYADANFDVVLNCDIIEHTLCNPVHMLAECHRVLKPGGLLVLTTPNVLRLDNVVRLLRGTNIYDKYVPESPSARHPREYTPDEIRRLLEWLGFDVLQLQTRDVTHGASRPGARRLAQWCLAWFALAGRIIARQADNPLAWRGEQIFLVARRSRPVNRDLPEFLFEAPGAARQLISALYSDGEQA